MKMQTAPLPTKPKTAGRALKVVPRDRKAILAAAIDELGSLEKELIPWRAKLKRVEKLREAIRAHFADEPATRAIEARGAAYLATLGPRAFERRVDCKKLVQEIGLKAYAAIASPTLTAIEEALAPDIVARCVTQDYVGARPLKTFEISGGA